MIRIHQLKLPLDSGNNDIADRIVKILRIKKEELIDFKIIRRSIDARKKDNVHYIYIVDVSVRHEERVLKRCSSKDISAAPSEKYIVPECGSGDLTS